MFWYYTHTRIGGTMSQMTDLTDERSEAVTSGPLEIPPIARKLHVSRIASAAVVLLVTATFAFSLARNERLAWPTVSEYMFNDRVLNGLMLTLELTAISMVAALVLAIILANMRLSANPVLRTVAWLYVWFFRGIPLLVLLILMFNFSLLYPVLSIGVPGFEPLLSARSQHLISPFWAAVLAFVLHQSAYSSEVIRSSILAVPKGQLEAAASLGMTQGRTLRRIVLPQSMRIAIPPIANDTIILLKSTSLVAFIAVSDLLFTVQQIYARNFQIIPLLLVATLWYIFIVSVMSLCQWRLERRFGRGVTRLSAGPRNNGKQPA
jgi:polar amino acid transport system permease protein